MNCPFARKFCFEFNLFGLYFPAGSRGLLDPCEKNKTDAAGDMTDQEREDLTAGAQVISHQLISHQLISHQLISHQLISHQLISHQLISY